MALFFLEIQRHLFLPGKSPLRLPTIEFIIGNACINDKRNMLTGKTDEDEEKGVEAEQANTATAERLLRAMTKLNGLAFLFLPP